jgi:serine protease Do
MALGFADLDRDVGNSTGKRPISQYLFGSITNIIDIERADGARGRPWPLFRVESDWPGGMSGGPVFNQAGHVIGLVSTGLTTMGSGSATYFAGSTVAECTFPSIDAANIGWVRCYATFDAVGNVVKCGPNRQQVAAFAESNGLSAVRPISFNAQTRGYVDL